MKKITNAALNHFTLQPKLTLLTGMVLLLISLFYINRHTYRNTENGDTETSFTNIDEKKLTPKNDTPAVTGQPEEEGYHYGIDISKWNGDEAEEIDETDSISFVICKATQGVKGTDHKFVTNWKTIKNKNYILGAYHFYVVGKDPVTQAEHFWNTISKLGQTDMSPIVDIELMSIPPGTKHEKVTVERDLKIFLSHLEKKSGRIPMIYTTNAFSGRYLTDIYFGKYPLWLAEYTNAPKPRIPAPWKTYGYKIWQRRDNYFIDSHQTDFDIFFGKKSDLIK